MIAFAISISLWWVWIASLTVQVVTQKYLVKRSLRKMEDQVRDLRARVNALLVRR